MDGGDGGRWSWLVRVKSWLAGVRKNLSDSWGNVTHRRILHFLFHFLSFVPTILIAAMACLIAAIPRDKILGFLYFTIATISLEVCFTCLRARFDDAFRIQKTGDKEEIHKAWMHVASCCVFVGAVVVFWVPVAFVEVGELGSVELIPLSRTIAGTLAGFNFAIALYKMWFHTGTVVWESLPDSEAVETPANHIPSQPVPR